MLPVRILLAGDHPERLLGCRDDLEAAGYEVHLWRGLGSVAFGLKRTSADLLIVEASAGSATALRRSVEATRMHRSLGVMVLLPRSTGGIAASGGVACADLGVVHEPYPTEEILARLDDWYESDQPALLAG